MKFFHLSDLHIGKHLYYYSLLEDQRHVLNQVLEAVKREKPDAILLSGDIYDKQLPSAEAVRLLDWFLTELSHMNPKITVLIIGGNHDSGERLEFARELLGQNGVHIAGLPGRDGQEPVKCITMEDEYGKVHFYLLPFTKPAYVRSLLKEKKGDGEEKADSYEDAVEVLLHRIPWNPQDRNVLLSHQFYVAGSQNPETCDSEIRMVGGVDQVDVRLLEGFDYAALGHIHRAQKIGKENYRYAGTLLKYSVSEAAHQKTFTMVTLGEKGKEPEIQQIPVEPLRDLKVLRGTLQELLEREDAAHDFVSITLTDEEEPYLPKERLELVFDHILEIRIDNARTRKILDFYEEEEEEEDLFTSFGTFFELTQGREMNKAEKEAVTKIWNEIQEGGGA